MATKNKGIRRFGPYIILDRIGDGGMAEIFLAKMQGYSGFEKLIALKKIHPKFSRNQTFAQMLIHEAKLAANLQHFNVVQVLDLGEIDRQVFIAMEYVRGRDLAAVLSNTYRRKEKLPLNLSLCIATEFMTGLDYAHRMTNAAGTPLGIIHRDISPQNLLISYEGEVKVIDFGIAKAANKVSKTQAGVLKGKFGYMSPEQVRGIELDNRSDIFACGVVLYELLVGDRLFLGESDFSTLEKVRNVEMVPPTRLNKNLSPQLERIVMKALAKPREDRYRHTSEMGEDLQRYLFATNQPFARTDLQRYMQQHFKDDLAQEKKRLEKYKTITFEQFKSTAFQVSNAPVEQAILQNPQLPVEPSTQISDDIQAQVMNQVPGQVAGQPRGRMPTALKPSPISLRDTLMPDNGRTAVLPDGIQPPVQPPTPQRSGLPAWAAGLIGGLVVLLLIGVAAVIYLMQSKTEPGSIVVQVKPAKAEILLNDKLVSNKAPTTLELAPNTYVLTVRAKGYEQAVRPVRVEAGGSRLESFTLELKKGNSSLIIKTKPVGLHIWVDGKDTGRITPATISQLHEGPRQVTLKRTGGEIVHRLKMELQSGAAETLEINTTRLPPVLDVVSQPEGAEVRVNGKVQGSTPVTISSFPAGRARIDVRKAGCKSFREQVQLKAATVLPVKVTLDCGGAPKPKAPPVEAMTGTGKLNVMASVVSDIFVDGEKRGRTPMMGLEVAAGKRVLKLVPLAGGKKAHEAEVLVKGGEGVKEFFHQF